MSARVFRDMKRDTDPSLDWSRLLVADFGYAISLGQPDVSLVDENKMRTDAFERRAWTRRVWCLSRNFGSAVGANECLLQRGMTLTIETTRLDTKADSTRPPLANTCLEPCSSISSPVPWTQSVPDHSETFSDQVCRATPC